jgi:ferric-dicitrate binding protein FerR (iron transport regulator)
MAGHRFRDRICERAHGWASLELDDELSQLERALLAAHLRRCGECAAYVAEMRATTAALRAAPLERPERPVVLQPVSTSSRGMLSLRFAAAAVLAVTAAGLGVFAGSLGRDDDARPVRSQPEIALLPSQDDLRDRSRLRTRERREPVRPSPDRLGGV